METKCKNNNTGTLKAFGFTGIALCAACCALPIIGSVVGIAGLAIIAPYLEKLGIIVLAIGILFFGYSNFIKKKNTCDINCSCKSSKPA